ncbi:MAG: hypothetical protein IT450_11205 [Phycisphaerales bacterium]|nr:hypothetical protein [Phycisphaerales bacterium]
MSRTSIGFGAIAVVTALSFLVVRAPLIVRAAADASLRDGKTETQSEKETREAEHKSDTHEDSAAVEPDHEQEAGAEKKAELKFDEEMQQHLGIVCEPTKAGTVAPSVRALGVVEEDASRTFILRAPQSGYLRPADAPWPATGTVVPGHTLVASLQPRLTPIERFSLENQLTEARAAVAEIETEQAAADASYESKRRLNEDGKVVSDRQFEEADAKRRFVQARLVGARAKLEQLQGQSNAVENGLEPLPLRVEQGGVVLEALAAPGETVESGQPLLRILVQGPALARIELPLGTMWTPMASGIRVAPLAGESAAQEAALVGPAPRAGSRTRGQTWLLRTADSPALAPGSPLVAHLPLAGEPVAGILVPTAAILRYGGLTWVFVREQGQIFERQAVRLIEPTPDGWLVQGEVESGALVVTHGAQLLLSEQLKAQIEAEAEASE